MQIRNITTGAHRSRDTTSTYTLVRKGRKGLYTGSVRTTQAVMRVVSGNHFMHTTTNIALSLVLAVACLFLVTPVVTLHAQSPALGEKAILELDPPVPGPYEKVTVRLKSYVMDVNQSTVVWLLNGEEYTSGVGLKEIQITTGAVGSATTIEVRLQESGGGIGNTYRIIRPAFVSILWEGNSYVPPLYKGLALHAPQTSVRVVAEPLLIDSDGVRVDPDNIQYEWYVNRDFLQDESGTGRRAIDVENPKFVRDLEVRVVASSPDGSIGANKTITIPVPQQELLFYEVHPLQGVLYERALVDDYTMTQSESELVAEPYYMTTDTREDSTLRYEWQLDGVPVDARGRIVVRPEGSGEGMAQLSLLIRNTQTLLQAARGELRITFTTQAREEGFFTREQ